MATIKMKGESTQVDDRTLQYLVLLGAAYHAAKAPRTGAYYVTMEITQKLVDWMKERKD